MSELQDKITESLIKRLDDADSLEDSEYWRLMEHLQKQMELDTRETQSLSEWVVKTSWVQKYAPMLTVGGSILSILILMAFEEKHVLTSKALGFVKKL